VAFSLLVLAVTVLHAAVGFSFNWSILLSPAILLAAVATFLIWLRFKTRHTPVDGLV